FLSASKAVLRVGDEQIDLAFTAKADGANQNAGWADGLRGDLRSMVEQARAEGAQPILLTYPSESQAYGAANDVIRAVAADGLPLIDVAKGVAESCPPGGCSDLFFRDFHATAIGNQKVATIVLDGLAETVVQAR